jgi:hypothetical protein
MKTLIIAGSHREAQAWLWEQSKKDPFRTAVKKANGIQLWDDWAYCNNIQDLMGRDRHTPIVFVGQYWKNPVYEHPLLREFSTPIPHPTYWGMDLAQMSEGLMALGKSSGKSGISANLMAQAFKTLAKSDATLTMAIHDEFLIEVKTPPTVTFDSMGMMQ